MEGDPATLMCELAACRIHYRCVCVCVCVGLCVILANTAQTTCDCISKDTPQMVYDVFSLSSFLQSLVPCLWARISYSLLLILSA